MSRATRSRQPALCIPGGGRLQAEGAGEALDLIVLHIIRRVAAVEVLRELVQKVDAQADLAQGGDDLAQGPVPRVYAILELLTIGYAFPQILNIW